MKHARQRPTDHHILALAVFAVVAGATIGVVVNAVAEVFR